MTRLILLMLIGCIGMTTNAVAHILENISADCGIEVTAVTTEAQAAGLQVKDLIIGVRGKRIAGENHFSRLLDLEQDRWIEVMRDGVVMRIDLPADTGFSGKMTVRTDG